MILVLSGLPEELLVVQARSRPCGGLDDIIGRFPRGKKGRKNPPAPAQPVAATCQQQGKLTCNVPNKLNTYRDVQQKIENQERSGTSLNLEINAYVLALLGLSKLRKIFFQGKEVNNTSDVKTSDGR
jgi:hypothetical protein